MAWTAVDETNGTCTLIAQPENDEDQAYIVTSIEITEKDYNKIKIGSRIRVIGLEDMSSGSREFKSTKYQLTSGNATVYVAAKDISEVANAEELTVYENRLVSATGMTVTDVKLPTAGDADTSIVLTLTKNGITYYAKADVTLVEPSVTDFYAFAKSVAVGDTVDFTGLLKFTRNGDAVEFTPVLTSLTAGTAAVEA